MAATFPRTDAALLAWSSTFSSKISLSPILFGLSVSEAAAYATVHGNFSTAMAAADKVLRTPSATAAKNTARTALKLAANQTMDLINGRPFVTVAQKLSLGMNVRVKPTPAPLPATSPGVEVKSVSAWTVNLKLSDTANSGKRGKPPGVTGAMIYSYVGAAPPVDMGAWTLEGMTGKTEQSITFASSNPGGTKVWFSAYWFNTRKQTGPMSVPITTNLQGGSVSMPMKMSKAA